MGQDLKELLKTEGKGVLDAHDPLARLFRQVMLNTETTLETVNNRMIEWFNNPFNRVPNDKKVRSTIRGNLMQELARPNMTWKVFQRGLRFLGVRKMQLHITLEWESKKVTTHYTVVDLAKGTDDDDSKG